MISTITPNWEFSDCVGYMVEEFIGGKGDKAKLYVSSAMARMKQEKEEKETEVYLKPASEIFINKNAPKLSEKIISVNYMEVAADGEIIKEKANDDMYKKFKREYPNPTPMYYLPFKISLDPGTAVTVCSDHKSLNDIYFTVIKR